MHAWRYGYWSSFRKMDPVYSDTCTYTGLTLLTTWGRHQGWKKLQSVVQHPLHSSLMKVQILVKFQKDGPSLCRPMQFYPFLPSFKWQIEWKLCPVWPMGAPPAGNTLCSPQPPLYSLHESQDTGQVSERWPKFVHTVIKEAGNNAGNNEGNRNCAENFLWSILREKNTRIHIFLDSKYYITGETLLYSVHCSIQEHIWQQLCPNKL